MNESMRKLADVAPGAIGSVDIESGDIGSGDIGSGEVADTGELVEIDGREGFRLAFAGTGAVFLDAAQGPFDVGIQQRIWSLHRHVLAGRSGLEGITKALMGMNNLLVCFDPERLDPVTVREVVADLWRTSEPLDLHGRSHVIDVTYGGEGGPDLEAVAESVGLSVAALIRLHSDPTYVVAAIGSMPGCGYLWGLPASLQLKRRAVPRIHAAAGSVIIGGGQASILPCDAPCGWHILGRTSTRLFDATAASPCLMQAGDRVVFRPRPPATC